MPERPNLLRSFVERSRWVQLGVQWYTPQRISVLLIKLFYKGGAVPLGVFCVFRLYEFIENVFSLLLLLKVLFVYI